MFLYLDAISLYFKIFLLHLSSFLFLYCFSLDPDVSLSFLMVSTYSISILADFSLYTWLFIFLSPKIYLSILEDFSLNPRRFISLSRRFLFLYMTISLSLFLDGISICYTIFFPWTFLYLDSFFLYSDGLNLYCMIFLLYSISLSLFSPVQ